MKSEVKLPVIVEDFEAGDRIYRYSAVTGQLTLGTVEFAQDDKVFLKMDDGPRMQVNIADFQEIVPGVRRWGKCLPLEMVEEGSRLSIDYLGATRFTVVQEISPEKMTLLLVDNPGYSDITEWDLTNEDTMNFILRKWELEG